MRNSQMRFAGGMLLAIGVLFTPAFTEAQGPANARTGGARSTASAVARMMAFDKNKDGKLTRDEVTDERLRSLFDRADANKDGVVTKEELTALFERDSTTL